MPKRKRFPPKSQSTSSQSPVDGSSSNQIRSHEAAYSEPVVHLAESSQHGSQTHASTHLDDQNLPNQPEGENVSQTQDEAQNPPPTNKRNVTKYWTVDVIDEEGVVKEAKLKVHDVFVLPAGKKIILKWNNSHQPIGKSGGLFGGFLGAIASNFANFPIGFEKWPLVPESYKEHVWNNTIKQKFVVSDENDKDWILSKIGRNWSNNRCELYDTYYDESISVEANIAMPPDGISRDQWALFCRYRNKPETKRMREQNRLNRQKQVFTHTLGSMSLARKKDEEENNQGRQLSRGEMYVISHKRKDGSFVNENARQKSVQLDAQVGGVTSEDAFTNVFGKEHPGRVRCMGFGVCPTQVLKSASNSGSSTMFSSSAGPSTAEWERVKLELEESKLESQQLKLESQQLKLESQQHKLELQESKSKVKFLEDQLSYLFQLQGRQLPAFPTTTSNQVEDVGSPAIEVRRSSSASHNVEDRAGSFST